MIVPSRWLRPLGLAVVGIVVLAHVGGSVGVGTSGAPLVVAVSVLVYAAAGVAFLLMSRASWSVAAALLAAMAAAAIALRLADPTGPVVGLFFVMAFAPLRLPGTIAAPLAVVASVAFNVAQAVTAPNPVIFVLVTDMGAVFFYFLGTLLVREHQQRTRADRLLIELEASREAERVAVAQAERGRLAREMHDVLAHTLSGLALQLEAARLLARDATVPAQLQATIERSHALAKDGLHEAKRAVSALRGDDVPGPSQLPQLVEAHGRDCGGHAVWAQTGTPQQLQPEVGLALYRAAQEALANVRKHAPGADVDVSLEWRSDGARLRVVNGPARQPPLGSGSGYGLTGMQERAQLLGGHVDSRALDDGFQVTVWLPLRRAA